MTKGEQRTVALERANEVRMARSQRTARMGASRLTTRVAVMRAVEILEENDPCMASMTLDQFMERLRGRTSRRLKARWLILAQTSPYKTVGELTDRQRAFLIGVMRGYAESRP
jgi:hypothetical protein